METIAVVDYGMGNLRSVTKAVGHVAENKARVILTAEPAEIAGADRVIFPGQGAAGECMRALQRHALTDILLKTAGDKPFLGICMGLQILLSHSDENSGVDCLDVLPGNVKYFGKGSGTDAGQYKIPHMGWNRVRQQKAHPLWQDIPDNARFYFVHSYYVAPADTETVAGVTDYAGREFPSALGRANLFAVQFHPEKSAAHGLQLLRNFVNWNGKC